MKRTFDDVDAGLACSECGRKLNVTLGDVRRSPKIACACGVTIKIDASQLDSSLSGVGREIDRLPKSIEIRL